MKISTRIPRKATCRICGEPITQNILLWLHITQKSYNHFAAPLVIKADRLLQLKQSLNRLPANSNYRNSENLLRMTVSKIDNVIGRANRMVFLIWCFERQIITSKINHIDGLHPHEAMAILLWAAPSKPSELEPWTYSYTFENDLELLRVHLARQSIFFTKGK